MYAKQNVSNPFEHRPSTRVLLDIRSSIQREILCEMNNDEQKWMQILLTIWVKKTVMYRNATTMSILNRIKIMYIATSIEH